jgi:hypothetical protein
VGELHRQEPTLWPEDAITYRPRLGLKRRLQLAPGRTPQPPGVEVGDEDALQHVPVLRMSPDSRLEQARDILHHRRRLLLCVAVGRHRDEAGVVSMRFGLTDGQPKTLDQIGKVYGVTRERIRQIESKAMSKLRHPSRSNALRDYLD